MAITITSVNGGMATLSNGQKVQLGTGPVTPNGGFVDSAGTTLASKGVTPGDQGLGGPKTPMAPEVGPNDTVDQNGNVIRGTLNAASATAGLTGTQGLIPGSSNPWTNAAPPGPAKPAAPAPTDYYAQYEAALGAARSNLEGQYAQAQKSIDQQQADANATLATVPGQFKTIDDQRVAGNIRENNTLLKADQAAGMGGTGSGSALARAQGEMNAAGTQNNAANKALVPSLGLGIKTQMDAERASLADAHSGAQAALDSAAMGVAAQRAGAAENRDAQTAAEKTAHDQAVADATTAYHRQLTLAAINSGATLNELSTKVPGVTVGDEKAITQSPYFSMITNWINTGKMPDGKAVSAGDITKTLSDMAANNNANIPGFQGNAGQGLLQVLTSYYGSNFGLKK